MKRGKLLYVKHKRFFTKAGGSLKVVGGIGQAKALPHHFLYLVDLDSGLRNFDLYDALTLHKPIVVEMERLSPEVVEKLYSIEAHVAFREEQVEKMKEMVERDRALLVFEERENLLPLFRDVFVKKCPPPFEWREKRIFCFKKPWEGAYGVVEE